MSPKRKAKAEPGADAPVRGKRKDKEWMPAFGRERLSDSQVADIAAYVQTLRE